MPRRVIPRLPAPRQAPTHGGRRLRACRNAERDAFCFDFSFEASAFLPPGAAKYAFARPVAVGNAGFGAPYCRWQYGLLGALLPLAIRALGFGFFAAGGGKIRLRGGAFFAGQKMRKMPVNALWLSQENGMKPMSADLSHVCGIWHDAALERRKTARASAGGFGARMRLAAKRAARRMAQAIAAQMRRMAQAIAEQMRRMAQAIAEQMRRMAQAIAEQMRRMAQAIAEQMRRMAQAIAEQMRRMAQAIADFPGATHFSAYRSEKTSEAQISQMLLFWAPDSLRLGIRFINRLHSRREITYMAQCGNSCRILCKRMYRCHRAVV